MRKFVNDYNDMYTLHRVDLKIYNLLSIKDNVREIDCHAETVINLTKLPNIVCIRSLGSPQTFIGKTNTIKRLLVRFTTTRLLSALNDNPNCEEAMVEYKPPIRLNEYVLLDSMLIKLYVIYTYESELSALKRLELSHMFPIELKRLEDYKF